MSLFKRILWFLSLNLVIILTISILLKVLGVQPYLNQKGMDYQNLLIFSLVVGFSGAFISLQLSRFMAKMFMKVQVLDPDAHNLSSEERSLIQEVYELASKAGLSKMPQVGIYPSAEVNAFATGPSRRRSLVAVSTGLLERMTPGERKGVLAHEVSHVANGDMVTMTLLQGVINTFVYFLARAAAFALSRSDENSQSRQMSYLLVFLFEMVFGLLGLMILAAFSRYREYRADHGGASLAGSQNMVNALEKLRMLSAQPQLVEARAAEQSQFSNFKISRRPGRFAKLFSTHPPLENRIARLKGQA